MIKFKSKRAGELEFMAETKSFEVMLSIPAPGEKPAGLCFDGKYLWNLDIGAKKLFRIEPYSGKVLDSVWMVDGGGGIDSNKNYIFVSAPEISKAIKFDPEGGVIVGVIDLERKPGAVCNDGDNSLLVCEREKPNLFKISLGSGKLLYEKGLPEVSFDMFFDGNGLWVCGKEKIYRIEMRSGEVIEEYIASNPVGITFDGEAIWYVDGVNKKIYKVKPKVENSL